MKSMIGSIGDGTLPNARPSTDPAPFTAEPLEVSHIVVPLDGSPFAERGASGGCLACRAVGADMHLVEVVAHSARARRAARGDRYLDSVSRRHRATGWDVVQAADVGQALSEMLASSPGRVAASPPTAGTAAPRCSDRWPRLLARSDRPAVLVGPEGRSVTAEDAPVLVAVDGKAATKRSSRWRGLGGPAGPPAGDRDGRRACTCGAS